ncbi:hypothetical protein HHI36_012660 [Cryptolaemus montrouzieri]|uniref:Uncharacterized protein n=1 Tax=Cryptolaemus montrouzieri TaxID=559131 RepID=A0ABD2NFS7_9CUCU
MKVSNIENFNTFRSHIKSLMTNQVWLKALSNQDINITVNNETDYLNIKNIPQCANCQQLGHTKNFEKENRDVSSVQNTKECKKQRNTVATCALYHEKGYPANYKGCIVYKKKLQELQHKTVSAVQRLQQVHDKVQKPVISTGAGDNRPQEIAMPSTSSYSADVKKPKGTLAKEQNTVTNEPTIIDKMELLSDFPTEIRKNFSQLSSRVTNMEKSKTSKSGVNKNKN